LDGTYMTTQQDSSAQMIGGEAIATQTPDRKRILLLEDDVALTVTLKEFLEWSSFEVVTVTGGAAGIREVMAADFDILLSDLLMPNVSGDMFYIAVQRIKPHLCERFVFMTGHRGDQRVEAFVSNVGASRVLWKPFSGTALLSVINGILRRVAVS
jgi:DNA-binding response OmpR family regulator